jgi:hypothetical protein
VLSLGGFALASGSAEKSQVDEGKGQPTERLDERSEVSVNFGAASMPVASEVGTRMQRQLTGHTWRRRSREQVDRAGIYTSLSGTVPASNYVSFLVNFQDEPERIWLSYSGT